MSNEGRKYEKHHHRIPAPVQRFGVVRLYKPGRYLIFNVNESLCVNAKLGDYVLGYHCVTPGQFDLGDITVNVSDGPWLVIEDVMVEEKPDGKYIHFSIHNMGGEVSDPCSVIVRDSDAINWWEENNPQWIWVDELCYDEIAVFDVKLKSHGVAWVEIP